MDFISIDVETANADLASICQIGVVQFKNGQIANRWQTLVNPEDFFDTINVSIHGIDAVGVMDAPKFPAIYEILARHLSGGIVVSHTAFDRTAIAAAFEKYDLVAPVIAWLDTARVVRRAWPDISQSGYGLANVTEKLGIKFQHHNAVEDARAAGEILVQAIQLTGLNILEWLERVKRPIKDNIGSPSEIIRRDGNPEGPLFGEVVVFTGALSLPRREAAELAAFAGCAVAPGVTKATTLLVVGDHDHRLSAGQDKSIKHRKADDLIAKGQLIRILRESDFHLIVSKK